MDYDAAQASHPIDHKPMTQANNESSSNGSSMAIDPSVLDDAALLTFVVGDAAADALLQRFGLAGVSEVSRTAALACGCRKTSADRLLAVVELAQRMARARIPARVRSPELASYLQLKYGRLGQEVLGIALLDPRRRLIADLELFRGGLFQASCDARTILREVLLQGASCFVVFHTHPADGDPWQVSAEDRSFTQKLATRAAAVGVLLVDHLVLGCPGRFFSFADSEPNYLVPRPLDLDWPKKPPRPLDKELVFTNEDPRVVFAELQEAALPDVEDLMRRIGPKGLEELRKIAQFAMDRNAEIVQLTESIGEE